MCCPWFLSELALQVEGRGHIFICHGASLVCGTLTILWVRSTLSACVCVRKSRWLKLRWPAYTFFPFRLALRPGSFTKVVELLCRADALHHMLRVDNRRWLFCTWTWPTTSRSDYPLDLTSASTFRGWQSGAVATCRCRSGHSWQDDKSGRPLEEALHYSRRRTCCWFFNGWVLPIEQCVFEARRRHLLQAGAAFIFRQSL